MSRITDSPAEFFGPGTHERFIEGGTYVVNVDTTNQTKSAPLSLSLPNLQASEYVDLRAYIGHRLVTSKAFFTDYKPHLLSLQLTA